MFGQALAFDINLNKNKNGKGNKIIKTGGGKISIEDVFGSLKST